MVKIDIGCGKNKREGFIGIDQYPMEGVDHVCRIPGEPLPFDHGTVDEVHCSHFIEHLNGVDRVKFVNELYRVMKPGAKATIIVPHWASNRAYGDPTHQWPPVAEMWFYYLSREWREKQAPHTDVSLWPLGFNCDFEATWGYAMNPALAARNVEYQQYASAWHKEAVSDLHATLTRK